MQGIMNTVKKNRILLLFLISGLLLCIRSRYGYSFNDEPFIVSLAQRLSYGDSLIVDEWNTAQNFGVILLPLYQLYVTFMGSTEGILLAFRLVYSVLWTLTCVAVYKTLSPKFSGAIICYFYLLLFSPLDQMTLSYTSFALMGCLLISCLFVYHLEIKAFSFFTFTLLYTVLSVITVLSQPYLAVGYVGLSMFFVFIHLVKRTDCTRFFFGVTLVSCFAAALTAAVYVYVFVFRNHTFSEVLLSLQNIFSGTKNAGSTAGSSILSYLKEIDKHYRMGIIALVVSCSMLCVPAIRNSRRNKLVIFITNACVFSVVLFKQFLDRDQHLFNTQVGPIVFLGICAYLFLDDKRKYNKLVYSFVASGILYSFCAYLASDTGIYAITMGLSICGVVGIVFIAEFYWQFKRFLDEDNREGQFTYQKRFWSILISISMAAIFAGQLGFQVFLKMYRPYWDIPVKHLHTSISCGAAEGIITEKETAIKYEERHVFLMDLLKNISYDHKNDIRFVSLISDPVQYLDADLPVGAFSTWTFMDSEKLIYRLNHYYSLNPDNVPNVILYTEGDAVFDGIQLDTSDYLMFAEGEYRLLVHPNFVRAK